MDDVVLAQVVRATEGLATHLTHMGTVTSVHALVSPQVLRAEEAAVAPKVLTRKPLPLCHNLPAVVRVVVVGNGNRGAGCGDGRRCSGGGSGGGGGDGRHHAVLASWLLFVGLWGLVELKIFFPLTNLLVGTDSLFLLLRERTLDSLGRLDVVGVVGVAGGLVDIGVDADVGLVDLPSSLSGAAG